MKILVDIVDSFMVFVDLNVLLLFIFVIELLVLSIFV